MLTGLLKWRYRHSAIGAALIGAAKCAAATSFYFAAHADDIELFMGRDAGHDVASGAKVVFVVVTSGSFIRSNGVVAVRGAGVYPGLTPASKTPYYLTREAGHFAALADWYKQQYKALGTSIAANVTISGKTVQRTEVGRPGSNVIMYNLRLVDGDDQDQSGFTWFRKQSLANPSTRIFAVDGSASYTWAELKTFVNALIEREQTSSDTWVNIPEYWEDGVPEVNYDHDDHKTTGRLVSHALQDYAAASPARCIRSIQWVGYATQDKPENYSASDKSLQDEVWTDLNIAKVRTGGPTTLDDGHARWLHKIYPSANGVGGVTGFGPCP